VTQSSQVEAAAPALRLQGVGRRFGALQAVVDLDLEIQQGERRAILGPNGAGKTTLFNVVTGDYPPTSGRVYLFGEDVTHLPPQLRTRRGLGRTYQTVLLFGGLSVADNLYIAARGVHRGHFSVIRPKRDDRDRARASEIAETIGLSAATGKLAGQLAHGELRQLELGMALASEPRLLMLDEPAAGLSPGERQVLSRFLAALPRSITVVLIEHDMDVALAAADLVTVMDQGRIIAQGTPAEIQVDATVQAIYLGHGYD
jgi:branched-chain amino acid transport system ATP-binding protein